MQGTIYNLFNANKKASLAVYKTLKKLKGFNCIVKTPINQGSIFGREDLVEYDEFVKSEKTLLLFGIFGEGTMGGQDFDTFIDGAFALTLWDDKIPLQSLIEVNFCGRYMTFKVDDHRNLLPTTCEQLFIKNILVPAT